MSIAVNLLKYKTEVEQHSASLVAVSKFHPVSEIMEAYEAGQRIFGENLVQEMVEKADTLPKDIEWHLIGHLQTNKVKYIAPFVSMIESVDSLKLLSEINKQALKNNGIILCLLQVYIADEETKFGLGFDEVIELLRSDAFGALKNIKIVGLMGMATNTTVKKQIKDEYDELKVLFDGVKLSFFRNDPDFKEISMGMSSDFDIALEAGSTMVRIGSLIFGNRPTQNK